MFSGFTPSYRGGAGPPLVCLHGFMDTWRSWELVLPDLGRRHDVLALTLPGHAGGPSLPAPASAAAMVDAVEGMMDEAGLTVAHLAGNSLGGYLALRLAARGRAASVVALAPAGGWRAGDARYRDLLEAQRSLHAQAKRLAPQADALLADEGWRRRATALITTNFEHIPTELLAHQLLGAATCVAAEALLDSAETESWALDARAISCPIRIVWGTGDKLLPYPDAATRYGNELAQADWVLLDGIGHCPQLDVPIEAAQLILGFTAQE